jgi:preprotein translocase subunit SecY
MTAELARRIALTLGALLLFRLGLQIPLPGIDLHAWAQIGRNQTLDSIGMAGWLPSGGASRMAIFALGIYPYVSAALLVQLVTIFSHRLQALGRRDDRGRRTIVRATLYLALLMTVSQALAVGNGLEQVSEWVRSPGPLFILSTVTTLTAGTMFLIWLSEQITRRGIGNGLAIILSANIVTELPSAVATTLELAKRGAFPLKVLAALLVLVVAVTALVVWVELARRKIPIQFSGGQVGSRYLDERLSHLSLKLNPAGVIPALVASWLLAMLFYLNFFVGRDHWLDTVIAQFGHGRPGFLIVYAVLIVFCTLLYTAFLIDPERTAERLKSFGGAIPAIEPGESTAAHIDHVVSRTTLMGAAYLALVCVLPEILVTYAQVPFYFGATALLVVVGTILDLNAQLRAELRSG